MEAIVFDIPLEPLIIGDVVVALASRVTNGKLFDPLVGDDAFEFDVNVVTGFTGFVGLRIDEAMVAAVEVASFVEKVEVLAPVDGEAANELTRAVKSPDAR